MSECGDGVLQPTPSGKYPVFSPKHHSPDDSFLSYSFFRNLYTYSYPGIIDHLMFDCFPPHLTETTILGHIKGS